MRAFLTAAIGEDEVLQEMGLEPGAVFSAENVDSPKVRPFIVIRFGGSLPSPAPRRRLVQPEIIDIWCYDTRGDYSRIDAMQARIRFLLESLESARTDTGWLTQIDWQSSSQDSYDDVWEAIARYATFKAVHSYLPG